jgi:hypothetical protein
MKNQGTKQYSNTDIRKVKQLNAESGMSYHEVKQALAETYMQNKK